MKKARDSSPEEWIESAASAWYYPRPASESPVNAFLDLAAGRIEAGTRFVTRIIGIDATQLE